MIKECVRFFWPILIFFQRRKMVFILTLNKIRLFSWALFFYCILPILSFFITCTKINFAGKLKKSLCKVFRWKYWNFSRAFISISWVKFLVKFKVNLDFLGYFLRNFSVFSGQFFLSHAHLLFIFMQVIFFMKIETDWWSDDDNQNMHTRKIFLKLDLNSNIKLFNDTLDFRW